MANNLQKSINIFYKKCAQLEIPPDKCPDENYLLKIFRQHLSLLENFNSQAGSKQEIDRIRKNILVQLKLSRNVGKKIPKEYNNYMNYNMLKDKAMLFETQIQSLKKQEFEKLLAIKNNDLRYEKSKEILRINRAKLDILYAKSINVNEDCEKEVAIGYKINKVTPKKFSGSDKIEEYKKKINECIEILKKFTTATVEETMCQSKKEKLWKDVSEIMTNIPNIVLFQLIMKRLNSKIENSIISNSSIDLKINRDFSTQEITDKLLPSLYEHKIVNGIELLSLRKKLANAKSMCAESIRFLEDNLDSLLNNNSMNFSSQFEEDDIISEFVSALIAKLNCEGKNQFCMNAITLLKQEIENDENTKEYDHVINKTKEINNLINDKIVSIQEHICQMYKINDKINFNKISFMRMVQTLKMQKSQQFNRTLMNQTLNSTVIAAPNKHNETNVPMYENEIEEFIDIELQKFDKNISYNSLLLMNDDNYIPNIITSSNHFLFPFEFLTNVEESLKVGNYFHSLLNTNLEPSVSDLPDVDFDALMKQYDVNCEEVSSILDNLTKFNILIQNHLRKIYSLNEYGMKNPLRKFIPQSKKYLDKTYSEYEKEYMLYYNMIRK